MNEDRCRFAGTNQPRVLVDRHQDGCVGTTIEFGECQGCQPCTRSHCRIGCGTHSAGVCGGCMTAMREDLADIARMTANLPDEVEHRGINGEAMSLLGPVADPEAWGHHEASAAVGRTAEQWTDGSDFLHPLWVTGSWASAYREAFDHEEPTELATVAGEVAYLEVHLYEIANYPHVPVEELAQALRKCRGHLEDVLLDGERAETGVRCHLCPEGERRRLVKHYADNDRSGASDRWVCPVDRSHWWNEAGYRLRVEESYVQHATALNVSQLTARLGVSRGSVTGWASDGKVRKRGKDSSGRQMYDVADVQRMMAATPEKRPA